MADRSDGQARFTDADGTRDLTDPAVGDPPAASAAAPAPVTDEFRGVGRGVRWSASAAVLLRLGQFTVGIVAARLIAPEQFGAFAVALTIYGVVLTLSDLGVSQAILREVRRTGAIGPTVMTLNMAATLALAGAMAIGADTLARAFGAADAAPAIRVLAATMVVGALGTVPAMVLAREYRQRERFVADAANFVTSSTLLILLGMQGWGLMALAWSRLAGQVVSAIVFNALVGERYRFGFDRREVGPLLRFSIPLAMAMAVNIAITNVDSLVISRFQSPTNLGYYNLAFNVAAWPVSILSQVMLNITTPTFARSQDDPAMLRYHLRSLTTALAAVALPAAALIITLAQPLVVTVYGQRWQPAAAPLVLLGGLTIVRLVQAMLTDLFTALGLTRAILRVHVLWLVVLVPAMLAGVHLAGAVGAGIAHIVVGTLVVIPAYLLTVHRRVPVGMSWMGPELLRPLGASVVAAAAAWLLSQAVAGSGSALAAGLVGGAGVYLALTGRWMWRQLHELRTTYGGGG